MSRMKQLLFAAHLPDAVEAAFEALIDDSLAGMYFGSEPRCGPVDADHARDLLFEMWRELVHDDPLWSAFARFLDAYAADREEDD